MNEYPAQKIVIDASNPRKVFWTVTDGDGSSVFISNAHKTLAAAQDEAVGLVHALADVKGIVIAHADDGQADEPPKPYQRKRKRATDEADDDATIPSSETEDDVSDE